MCCLLYQPIKLRHRACLDGVHNVDIRLHGLVVGVAGPFHDDVGGDALRKGVHDKGAAAGVGAYKFVKPTPDINLGKTDKTFYFRPGKTDLPC